MVYSTSSKYVFFSEFDGYMEVEPTDGEGSGGLSSTRFYYDEDREYCTTESLAISRNGNVVAMTRGLHNSTEFDRITLFRSV